MDNSHTAREVGQTKGTQEPHLDKPTESRQGCRTPGREPLRIPLGLRRSPAKTPMPPGVGQRDNRTSPPRIQISKSDATENKCQKHGLKEPNLNKTKWPGRHGQDSIGAPRNECSGWQLRGVKPPCPTDGLRKALSADSKLRGCAWFIALCDI